MPQGTRPVLIKSDNFHKVLHHLFSPEDSIMISVIGCVHCVKTRSCLRGISSNERDCSVAMYPGLKTGTRFLPSRPLRSVPEPSKFRCINYFMMAKNHQNEPFRNENHRLSGAIPTGMPGFWRNSSNCPVVRVMATGDCFFFWLRRWQGRKLLDALTEEPNVWHRSGSVVNYSELFSRPQFQVSENMPNTKDV